MSHSVGIQYNPTFPSTTDPAVVAEWAYREFARIAEIFAQIYSLPIAYDEVAKPREGMLTVAEGAPYWDPGSGAGLYLYKGGVWNKL